MVATARPCEPCQLCHCQIDDTRNRRNLGIKTTEYATASLDKLCSAVGRSRKQLVPGPVCKKCFQNLEKLAKAQMTVNTLTEQFLSYLQGRTTPLQPVLSAQCDAGPAGTRYSSL